VRDRHHPGPGRPPRRVTGHDLAPYALDRARADGLGTADNHALHTLLAPALAICATTAYTNGQHRGQAMIDQVVRLTVTVP
jgi:hypothetical protein